MPGPRLPKLRFRLGTFMPLFLGAAIGFALNQRMLHLWFAPPSETNMRSLPTCVIEPPDILQVKANSADGSFEEHEVPNYHILARKPLDTIQATSGASEDAELHAIQLHDHCNRFRSAVSGKTAL